MKGFLFFPSGSLRIHVTPLHPRVPGLGNEVGGKKRKQPAQEMEDGHEPSDI